MPIVAERREANHGQTGEHLFTAVWFWCPGCDSPHRVLTDPPEQAWGWNGDLTAPTFTPSVLVTRPGGIPDRCHSFVTDGRIQYLTDCTHALAGQTVPLPEWRGFDGGD